MLYVSIIFNNNENEKYTMMIREVNIIETRATKLNTGKTTFIEWLNIR